MDADYARRLAIAQKRRRDAPQRVYLPAAPQEPPIDENALALIWAALEAYSTTNGAVIVPKPVSVPQVDEKVMKHRIRMRPIMLRRTARLRALREAGNA